MPTLRPDRDNPRLLRSRRPARLVVLGAAALLAACAFQPTEDAAYTQARTRVDEARADQQVRKYASVPLEDAEQTLLAASQAESRAQLRHLVYLTEKKVDISRAVAERRAAEDKLKILLAEGQRKAEAARLAREVEQERAAAARNAARNEGANDPVAAALSGSGLDAQETSRGVVLTLPDVLFDSGRAELNPAVARNLDSLVDFLKANPRRRILIEGHTDNTGSNEANLALSLARANSVKAYLVRAGVGPERISTLGHGANYPAVRNDSSAGRQRNRRVEILVERAS